MIAPNTVITVVGRCFSKRRTILLFKNFFIGSKSGGYHFYPRLLIDISHLRKPFNVKYVRIFDLGDLLCDCFSLKNLSNYCYYLMAAIFAVVCKWLKCSWCYRIIVLCLNHLWRCTCNYFGLLFKKALNAHRSVFCCYLKIIYLLQINCKNCKRNNNNYKNVNSNTV